jgi:hypothetical protein
MSETGSALVNPGQKVTAMTSDIASVSFPIPRIARTHIMYGPI